jgi:uncharacterized membrane protein (UPF0136 family)
MSHQSLDQVAIFLGVLTAGGGITGYARTGSIPSVAAGCTVGALVGSFSRHLCALLTERQYILGGTRIRSGSPYGIELALLASIILAGSSIPRALRSGKPLPIGLSILATFGLYTYGLAYANKTR